MDGIDLNSPEELLRAFEADLNGTADAAPESEKQNNAPATDTAKDDEGKTKKDDDPQVSTTVAEEDAKGIASKNGDHVIPYSVLKSERERAKRAEQTARETQAELEKLQAQLKSNQGAKDGEGARTNLQTAAEDLSEEELAILKEDNPAVYRALLAIKAKAESIESKLNPVVDRVAVEEANRARTEAEIVQEAIDSVPKLAHVAATDPAAYALAQQFDTALKANPLWVDKPLSERFSAVIDMVEKAIGPIQLPNQKASLSTEEIAKAAKAKAAEQAKETRSAVPTSLSEFPAGKSAAMDEREALESMSVTQLAARFASMTPEQQEAYLNGA